MEIDDIIDVLFNGTKEQIEETLKKERISYNFAKDLQEYTIKNNNTYEVVRGYKCHYEPNCIGYFGYTYKQG